LLSIFIITGFVATIIIGFSIVNERDAIQDFNAKFGTLTEGMQITKKSKIAPYWTILSLLRWLLTSLILV
jgi:hypothetical protein